MHRILEVEDFIFSKLDKELPHHLQYHGAWHTRDVFRVSGELASHHGLNRHDATILLTAALFHDTGFLSTYKMHEEASCVLADKILPDYGFNSAEINEIKVLIMATKVPQSPHNFLSELLCDADLDYLGGDRYDEIAQMLYHEFIDQGIVDSELGWFRMQVKFLESHTYFNAYSIEKRALGKAKNLEKVKNKLIELENIHHGN